eukprot:GHVL01038737.1.p1 GENE.GHVL01038737.1~~GHVL01038737.1.p1  ORF type:complete len:221 (-),score=44.86 GHVL01038737.1:300-962(-)
MMSNVPPRPESALKRCDEFLNVDNKEEALKTLHAALSKRAVRNQWAPVYETVAEKYLQLCLDLQKLKYAKDGIIQYRNICQQANVNSLEKVVLKFRVDAEKKLEDAKMKAKDVATDELEDLEAEESPEAILLATVQLEMGRDPQENTTREMHSAFRFVWETYKTVLDVLRNNAKLEDLYHQTAIKAFEFCRINQRPQEFKRLCDMLRTHYSHLQKSMNLY